MKEMDGLTFAFVVDLYRIKEKALKRNDETAIESLKKTYSFIFSEEFENFILLVKNSAEYLDEKHGTHFKEMLEVEITTAHMDVIH